MTKAATRKGVAPSRKGASAKAPSAAHTYRMKDCEVCGGTVYSEVDGPWLPCGGCDRNAKLQPIFAEIEEGLSLRQACRKIGSPAISTVMEWVANSPNLAEQYARALSRREEVLHDELLTIADDGRLDRKLVVKGDMAYQAVDQDVVQRSRLMVDTRKWILARMNPKKYGDRVETVVEGGEKPVKMEGALSVALDFEAIRARREKVGA